MEPPTPPESVSLNNGLLPSTLAFLRSTFYIERDLFIACHIISFPCVKPSKGFPVYSELKLVTMTFRTPHEFPWLLLSLLFSFHSRPFAVPYIFSRVSLPWCWKCYSLCLEYSSLLFLSYYFFTSFVCVKSLSRVRLFETPWTVAHQAPLSMGFSRQEYWSGLPFSSPGDLPNLGIKPGPPALQADALTSEPPGKSCYSWWSCKESARLSY